ncbi:MAG: 50S ribosomal protein L25 [Simkaniaceae bacterium]|nr:50S ribosomal protein L25 [Simkaniaceae bacterium]
MKLIEREGKKKSELTAIRFRSDIPVVMYESGKSGRGINAVVNGREFDAVLRKLPKGYLPTTLFDMEWEGTSRRAIVKDIQYHPTTYGILHIDFMVLDDAVPVDLKVPVVPVGEAECTGVKLGGFLRHLIRHVRVRCLPKHIPTDFKVDVRPLDIGDTKRVRDIEVGSEVRMFTPGGEVVFVIAKR